MNYRNEHSIGRQRPQDIMDALREYMHRVGSRDAQAVPWELAKAMQLLPPDHGTKIDNVSIYYTLSQTFEGQVQRGLRALALAGELIWVKKGDKTTWGAYMSVPRFWTVEQYGKDDQAAREKAQRDVILRNRRRFIIDTLTERGFHPREAERHAWLQEDMVYLSVEDWETLLGLC